MKPMEKEAYNYCFKNLTPEEKDCAEMCESIIVYDGDFDDEYLEKFKRTLGKRKVRSIYNRLSNFINTNCTIVRNIHCDSEGVNYNSLMWKSSPLEYQNAETGEITTNHKKAVDWFNKGAIVRLYTDGNYRVSWVH